MARRGGSTLVEVLVAIFVMGIGLIALLTLFPIGALRMAQSIHDDRCAMAVRNAHALAIAQSVRTDPLVVAVPATGFGSDPNYKPAGKKPGGIADCFYNPCLEPGQKKPTPATHLNADPFGESYAVLADPVGYASVPLGSVTQNWVGGIKNVLRRRPVSYAPTAQKLSIYQTFTLWDDINFDGADSPGTPQKTAKAIFRDYRFSWAYLLRRPQSTQNPTPNAQGVNLPNLSSVVDCTVIVFDARPLSLTGNLSLPEYVYGNTNNTPNVPQAPGALPVSYFNPSTNSITIDYSSNKVPPPPVRPGSWILDATIYHPTATTATQHAYFYRVVSIQDVGATLVTYEVQSPIRGFGSPGSLSPLPYPLPATTYGFPGTAIVLDGIAEVFEQGPVRIP
jgi:hypothetical protein